VKKNLKATPTTSTTNGRSKVLTRSNPTLTGMTTPPTAMKKTVYLQSEAGSSPQTWSKIRQTLLPSPTLTRNRRTKNLQSELTSKGLKTLTSKYISQRIAKTQTRTFRKM